jgi:transposase
MLGLLKRHEVEVLLKAGHRKAQVVGLARVSRSSVKRISDESPVVQVDDAVERAKRRIGRTSRVEGFRKQVVDILQKEPDLPSLEVLRRVRGAGYKGCRSSLYALAVSVRLNAGTHLRPLWLRKWRALPISQEDMLELKKWRRSNDRTKWAKAVVLMDSHQGNRPEDLSSKVEKCPRLVKEWVETYMQSGLHALCSNRKKRQSPEKLASIKERRDRIVEILHEAPQIHGINRASWSLKALARAFEKQHGQSIGKSTISDYVRAEGYRFRKARRVLTSPDPNYREKLQEITRVLSHLRDDEKFFSIDEFGPFSVRMRGGSALTQKGTTRVIPQRQRSKGRLIVTAALELSTNQTTHFYSDKKNTDEMIKLLNVLLRKYSDQRCLNLSWDVASWHVSDKLNKRVEEVNLAAKTGQGGTPVVKLLPLPVSAQFLNVIESVFSGMAKAILHNSDYGSVEDCKTAIDKYFAERNEAFRRNPRRAGQKIWGNEIVRPWFAPTNNCKDPNWR